MPTKFVYVEKVFRTDADRQYGLMNDDHPLSPSGVALFDFTDDQRPMHMWMKNTLVPLDMIFLDESYVVLGVHRNAIPLDVTPIYAPQSTCIILEALAGYIDTHSIKRNDSIAFVYKS